MIVISSVRFLLCKGNKAWEEEEEEGEGQGEEEEEEEKWFRF